MNSLRGTLGVMLLATMASAAWPSAHAQVDLSGWPKVSVEVLAVDQNGTPLPGLTADSIEIREGKQPRPILSLEPLAQPQSVCLLIDASDAMFDRLSTVLTKARRLLPRLPADDEVCIAHYNAHYTLDQPLTGNRATAIQSLGSIRPWGQPGLRDAILALADYMRTSAHNRSRAILLFSDAVDHASTAGKDEIRRGLEGEGTPILHVICIPPGFGRALRKQIGEHTSAALALASIGGGIAYFPHTILEIDAVVDGLPALLQSRYRLSFEAKPATEDGRERPIDLSFVKGSRLGNSQMLGPPAYLAPAP